MLTSHTVAVLAWLVWDSLIHLEDEVCQALDCTRHPINRSIKTQIVHVWRYASLQLMRVFCGTQAIMTVNRTRGRSRRISIYAT